MIGDKDAMESQKLLQVSNKLYCLFRSTAAEEFESYCSDLNEQRMLVRVLQAEKLHAANKVNVLKRFPFLDKPSKDNQAEKMRQSLLDDLGRAQSARSPQSPIAALMSQAAQKPDLVALSDPQAQGVASTVNEKDAPIQIKQTDEILVSDQKRLEPPKEIRKMSESSDTLSRSSSAASLDDIDIRTLNKTEDCPTNQANSNPSSGGRGNAAVSTVFNVENIDEVEGTEGSSADDVGVVEGASAEPRKSAKPAVTSRSNLQNLLVWHRYTEIPFDISSSEFTVKTPVLPLVQGGHLVFLTSRSGQRITSYSVKIIKKVSLLVTGAVSFRPGGAKAHKPPVDTAQVTVINKDEFLMLKKMAHPCVASLLYFCENEFQYYYFFPNYVFPGLTGSLSLFNRQGPAACVYVICCIINAVEYLFRNFIVHRDISAKNILFSLDGRPVLFHFDYAAFFGSVHIPEAKPNYLPDLCTRAPEVISALIPYEPDYYANCDVWGIGVLLGELLLSTKVMMRALKRKLDPHWVFSVRQTEHDARGNIGNSGFNRNSIPRDLMELVRLCLRKSGQDRPNVHNLMQNPLFTHYGVANVSQVTRQKMPIDKILSVAQML